MLHIIKSSRLDFMRLAKPLFAITWAIIVLGLAYGIFVRVTRCRGSTLPGR